VIVERVTKRFGATVAVDDVTLSVDGPLILGLVGENGAGKTTLMRIVAGELGADSGRVETSGRVSIVHQHFALVPDFTIAENLALGRRGFAFTSRRAMNEKAERTIAESGIALGGVSRRAEELAVGEKSKLELIKAIAVRPQLLILDEPTSVLTPLESEELFAVMRRLRDAGTTIVFISHKVRELLEVSQRVVVMRSGRVVAEGVMTAGEIATAMIGKPPSPAGGAREGRITAIVGVAGNGQAELLESMRRPGIAFIPEDRTRDGIVAQMSIAENLALNGMGSDPSALIDLYGIRARGPKQLAGELSGGNQQKVVLARELDRKPEMIVAAEPTRGLDIEATRVVHDQLRAAVAAGARLVLVTSDLDEAFALAGTVQVIYRGKLSEPMTPQEAEGRVAKLMAGLE
jgi:simple sugar transport system ATP-binding protein